VKPLDHENTVRVDILKRITNAAEKRYPGSRLHCFGSFATGLFLPDGDMDVVLLSNHFVTGRGLFNWKREMHTLMNHLVRCGIAEDRTYVIIKRARVPILKFIDSQTGVQVDMSFDNDGGVRAVETILDWKRLYPDMPILVAIVKQFLLIRGLNEVVNGGLGGFSVICLVIHFLRQHPLNGFTTKRRGHLGKLLLEFFDFYGNTFDYNNLGIDMHSGAFRKVQPIKKWMIMNPHDRNHDISSGTFNAPMIAAGFSEAHTLLKQQMSLFETTSSTERRSSSILGAILGANYQSYKDKRYILRSVHERLVVGEGFIIRLVKAHHGTDVLAQAIQPAKLDAFMDQQVDIGNNNRSRK
jgi:non-canonical poly(A) RNA polymerase PAPD5/7